jgi:hypothetical protein
LSPERPIFKDQVPNRFCAVGQLLSTSRQLTVKWGIGITMALSPRGSTLKPKIKLSNDQFAHSCPNRGGTVFGRCSSSAAACPLCIEHKYLCKIFTSHLRPQPSLPFTMPPNHRKIFCLLMNAHSKRAYGPRIQCPLRTDDITIRLNKIPTFKRPPSRTATRMRRVRGENRTYRKSY